MVTFEELLLMPITLPGRILQAVAAQQQAQQAPKTPPAAKEDTAVKRVEITSNGYVQPVISPQPAPRPAPRPAPQPTISQRTLDKAVSAAMKSSAYQVLISKLSDVQKATLVDYVNDYLFGDLSASDLLKALDEEDINIITPELIGVRWASGSGKSGLTDDEALSLAKKYVLGKVFDENVIESVSIEGGQLAFKYEGGQSGILFKKQSSKAYEWENKIDTSALTEDDKNRDGPYKILPAMTFWDETTAKVHNMEWDGVPRWVALHAINPKVANPSVKCNVYVEEIGERIPCLQAFKYPEWIEMGNDDPLGRIGYNPTTGSTTQAKRKQVTTALPGTYEQRRQMWLSGATRQQVTELVRNNED